MESKVSKEVLVIFNDRRRPVKFECFENPSENYQSLVNAVEKVFCDILTAEEGSSSSGAGFYLQVESKEWGGIIDVTSETQIDDHSTVFLCKPKSHLKSSTVTDAASSDANGKVTIAT